MHHLGVRVVRVLGTYFHREVRKRGAGSGIAATQSSSSIISPDRLGRTFVPAPYAVLDPYQSSTCQE